MAACIPSGKPSSQDGFTYLGVLFLIVVIGMGLASAGELWATASRRDREHQLLCCLLYTSPSPRDRQKSRMPSSA